MYSKVSHSNKAGRILHTGHITSKTKMSVILRKIILPTSVLCISQVKHTAQDGKLVDD